MSGMLAELSKVSPGTALREAIENIIRAHTGALIVVGGEPEIDQDCEGGVRLSVPFHPSLVYELAKMDGAIILDQGVTEIRAANVELSPKVQAPSFETGMRHRTAERIARTRDCLVIAISQRRSTVSLYYGSERYMLHDLSYILSKASGALNSLSRYDRLFRSALRRLLEAELSGRTTLEDVVDALKRGLMAMQIRGELHRYVVELGRDGHLIDIQMEEYPDVSRDWQWIWQDYQQRGQNMPLWERLDVASLTVENWLDWMGYPGASEDDVVTSRGVRLLHTVPRLPETVIQNLTARYPSLNDLRQADVHELDGVPGVGPQRASAIWHTLHPQEAARDM